MAYNIFLPAYCLCLYSEVCLDMSSRILFKKSPDYSACPSCSSFNTIRRSSSRNWVEYIIAHGTFFRIYRCKNCGWRGYLSTLSITSKSVKNLLLYILLGIVSAFLVREVLKRFISWASQLFLLCHKYNSAYLYTVLRYAQWTSKSKIK